MIEISNSEFPFKFSFRSALAKSKTKEIKGDMRLYKSENYTDFYTGKSQIVIEFTVQILFVFDSNLMPKIQSLQS